MLEIKLIDKLYKVRLINLICYTVQTKTRSQARSSRKVQENIGNNKCVL